MTRNAGASAAAAPDAASAVPAVLFISYDGVLEPLGQSQVLAYLERLAARGADITLLSFEKPADLCDEARVSAVARRLAASGIEWLRLRYHKRPSVLATAWDVARGVVHALRAIRRHRVGAVHARSYVPGVVALIAKRLTGVKMIFDMRGFWADERVDGGLWRAEGWLYTAVKRVERHLLREADQIITLTCRARDTVERWPGLQSAPAVTVIPTCVDLDRFPRCGRRARPAPVFAYVGSVGTWYLLDEMCRFVREALERYPESRFLILTRERVHAERTVARGGLPPGAVTVTSASPDEVAGCLTDATVALAFYKPGFARQATCPTKIGEYLAMGLPVVVNEHVGDVRDVIGPRRVGVVLSEFSTDAYRGALDDLSALLADPDTPDRCRATAEELFSLELGVTRYWTVYQALA